MKKSILACLVLSFLLCANGVMHAQSLSPQSVNSVGVNMTQSNGALFFTVGDLVVETQTDGEGNSLGGGFTNSAEATVSVENLTFENLSLEVFPNPATDWVNLQFSETLDQNVTITVVDLEGKAVHQEFVPRGANPVRLQTNKFAAGIYLVNLRSENDYGRASFKLIKTN